MPATIYLLVYALAVARVTRLLTADKITEPARERLQARLWRRYAPQVPASDWDAADPPMPVYLIGCPWCVSIYLGAVAAPLVWFWGSSPWLLVPALALAFSQVAGFSAQVGK